MRAPKVRWELRRRGGWTTLCALVGTSTFACGISLFGVADLEELVRTTHDFESRYVEKP